MTFSNKNGLVKPWLMWGMCACFVFYQFLIQVSPSIMVFHLQELLGRSADSIALLSSAFFYMYLIAQLPAGILIDLFGAKRILSVSIVLLGIAVSIFALSYNYYTLLLARILMGFFCASAVAGTLYVAANWFSPKLFALAAGLTEMLGMIGGALGQEYLAKLSLKIGYDNSMFYCSLIAAVLFLIILIFLSDKPGQRFIKIDYTNVNFKCFLGHFLKIVKSGRAWLNGIIAGILFLPIGVFAGLWAIPYFQTAYSMNSVKAAMISSMIFWGAALGCTFFGWLCEKKEKIKKLIYIICNIGCLIIISILIYGPVIPNSYIIMLMLLFGFISGGYVISFVVAKELVGEEYKASILAFTNMAVLLGALILQPLVSVIINIFSNENGKITANSMTVGLTVLPVLFLIGIIIIPFLKTKKSS